MCGNSRAAEPKFGRGSSGFETSKIVREMCVVCKVGPNDVLSYSPGAAYDILDQIHGHVRMTRSLRPVPSIGTNVGY